jgi:hypothetical protein
MQLVPPSHLNERAQFTDDAGNGWNLSCMLCGRTNAPPVSIDELAVRRRRLDLNAHGTTLPHRTNTPRNRKRAIKDADYRRCLEIVRELTEPFTTREIAERMDEAVAHGGGLAAARTRLRLDSQRWAANRCAVKTRSTRARWPHG